MQSMPDVVGARLGESMRALTAADCDMRGCGNDDRARRIYDPPAPDDGRRILVDRLWPRGVSRSAPTSMPGRDVPPAPSCASGSPRSGAVGRIRASLRSGVGCQSGSGAGADGRGRNRSRNPPLCRAGRATQRGAGAAAPRAAAERTADTAEMRPRRTSLTTVQGDGKVADGDEVRVAIHPVGLTSSRTTLRGALPRIWRDSPDRWGSPISSCWPAPPARLECPGRLRVTTSTSICSSLAGMAASRPTSTARSMS